MAANWGIDEILPQTAAKVLLPLAHVFPKGLRDGILINRAEYRLYYFKGGVLVMTVPVGIGLPALPTPLGKTTIIDKRKNPTWTPTATARREHPDWPTSVEPGITNPSAPMPSTSAGPPISFTAAQTTSASAGRLRADAFAFGPTTSKPSSVSFPQERTSRSSISR